MLLVFSLIFRFFPYGRLRVKYPVSYRILYCRWDRNLCAVCITRRIFLRIDWWKNFENWSTFAKVINKHQVAYFFETPCSCYLKRIGLSNVVMRTLPRWWERYRGSLPSVTLWQGMWHCQTVWHRWPITYIGQRSSTVDCAPMTNDIYRSEVIDRWLCNSD